MCKKKNLKKTCFNLHKLNQLNDNVCITNDYNTDET